MDLNTFAIDTSYYEPVKNWPEANPMPKHIIARATYGVRKDTEFLYTWKFCRDQGIPRAAYHYWYGTSMYSGQTAADGVGDQADNFVNQIIEGGYTGKERLWIDLEESGNTTVSNGKNYRNLVKQWLDHVERETGQKPGIYSRKDQLARMMINGFMPEWIDGYDIWLAWYPFGTFNFPILVPGHIFYPSWLKPERLVMHQYTDQGEIPTLRSKENNRAMRYDFNYMYPGYFERLEVTPQSTTGETTNMESWMEVNTISGLKVRAQPNTSSQTYQALIQHTKIRVIERMDSNWVKFDIAFLDEQPVVINGVQPYYCASAYLIPTTPPVNAPTNNPPDPTPDPTTPPTTDQFPPALETVITFPNIGISYRGNLTKE